MANKYKKSLMIILTAYKNGILKCVEKSYNIKIPRNCFTLEKGIAIDKILDILNNPRKED